MSLDKISKKRLFEQLSEESLQHKRTTYWRKILLWEITLRFSYLLKRIIDISFSLILLFFLSPLFLITAILIKWEDPGPVFYSQKRVGKNGRLFDFYKFRSMVVNADKLKDELLAKNESQDGVIFKMRNDPRITKVGRFIRRFSIDELPQIVNVLKGDMSLVGPRPPIPREVDEYTIEDRKRLHIKPGITCIWQVSGRSNIPFNEQVELDKEYIRSKSFKNDLKILLKTIPAVIAGDGAY